MEDDPTYDISIRSMTDATRPCAQRVERVIREALSRHAVRTACVAVAIVDDREIAELNRRHLGRDEPTDVLSFDLRDHDTESEAVRVVDADLVLSLETAAREAERRGHDVESELALYALHGTLHLLGYNDHNGKEAARMHAKEDEILTAAGFGAVYGSSEV